MGAFGSVTLTRRTATVTISVPDAATASAVSSRSLYFPVPTMRARSQAPSGHRPLVRVRGTAADEVHDLHPVSVVERGFGEGRPAHDLTVALYGDPARVEPEFGEQSRHRHGRVEGPGFPVDANLHEAPPAALTEPLGATMRVRPARFNTLAPAGGV